MKIKYICPIFILFLLLSIPVRAEYYPLVVYSGEPEGIMAAVSAARSGTNTLLIMERENPGGLMTYGNLNYLDLTYGPDNKILSNNLFKEWHKKVGGEVSFSVENAIDVFNNMINSENNLTVLRSYKLLDLKVASKKIINLKIANKEKVKMIITDRIIDASQDAKLAVKAGAPCFYGGADIGLPERSMAATLILKLGNINLNNLKKDVLINKFGPSRMSNNHAWGFIKLGRMYRQHNEHIRLRGLNIVLDENNNWVYINGLLIFNVKLNPDYHYSEISPEEAYKIGKNEAKYVLRHLRENLGGFKNAKLLEFPPELYIRENRHIVSRYQLKTSDLFANRILDDTIALAGYPLDYQASEPDYDGFVLFNPLRYGIPFRSLIPYNIDNLLIVGRSAGYSSLTAASARVLPVGMSAGEAAGVAADLSLKNKISFPDMFNRKDIIHILQDKLAINNNLPGTENKIIKDDVLYPYIDELISWGLVIGGYNNNFRLDETATENLFANLLIKGLKRKKAKIFYEWIPGGLTSLSTDKALTRDKAAELLLAAISHPLANISKQNYENALNYNLFPEIMKDKLTTNRLLTRREAFIITGNFLLSYKTPQEIRFFRGEK